MAFQEVFEKKIGLFVLLYTSKSNKSGRTELFRIKWPFYGKRILKKGVDGIKLHLRFLILQQ